MNELIGLTVKTHGHGYIGKVAEVERSYVGPRIRKQFGIEANEPYIALAVRLEDTDSVDGWTTFVARDGFEIHKRYVLA